MKCSNCGADNKNDAKFCKKCGSVISYSTKSKKSSGKIIAIVIAAIVALAIAAVVVFFTVFEGSIDNLPFVDNTESTTEETEAKTEENTTQPTITEPETTEPSTQMTTNGVTVPDVIGLKYSDAYQKLDDLEFKCKAVYQYSDTVAKGYVISQYPAEGKTLDNDETVIVYVSTGSDTDVVSSASGTTSAEYILYGSDSRYLAKSEITSLSKSDMELALNEIYARHGRIFTTNSISDYFNSKSWYRGTVKPGEFNESVFNKYEKANRDLIIEVMEEKGYR